MQTIRQKVPSLLRVILGLAFAVFGLNGFVGFLPMPPHPGPAGEFLGALAATGYMFPLIKGTELLAGLLLLTNRFVPLALALLAPVLVNILAFHLFLDSAGIGMVVVFLAAEVYLAWSYRHAFLSMLRARTEPQAAATARSVGAPAHQPA